MNNSLPNEDSSNVLGWHDSHCASAVLLRGDGSIAYALAEERLNGKKLEPLAKVLGAAGLCEDAAVMILAT